MSYDEDLEALRQELLNDEQLFLESEAKGMEFGDLVEQRVAEALADKLKTRAVALPHASPGFDAAANGRPKVAMPCAGGDLARPRDASLKAFSVTVPRFVRA